MAGPRIAVELGAPDEEYLEVFAGADENGDSCLPVLRRAAGGAGRSVLEAPAELSETRIIEHAGRVALRQRLRDGRRTGGTGAFLRQVCIEGVGLRDGWARRRERILKRDRLHCVYCAEAFAAEDLTLDHVEPRMRGGDESEGNLVAACRPCNELKGGMAAWAFLARRPDLRVNFLSAAESCDATHARPVWKRLLRAVREAAEKGT